MSKQMGGQDHSIANRVLSEEERLYVTMIDMIPQIAWSAGIDGVPAYFNARWYEYTGTNRERLDEFDRFLHPDDIAPIYGFWEISLRSISPFTGNARLKRADGQYRWHSVRTMPHLDKEGKLVGWFGTSTDIHDQIIREKILSFLNDLNNQIRDVQEPELVVDAILQLLGEHLQASRCAYGEVLDDGHSYVVKQNYCVNCQDVRGEYRISIFGDDAVEAMAAGRPLVIDDVATDLRINDHRDQYLSTGVLSNLVVPLRKRGVLVALIAVNQSQPRIWTADEIEVVQAATDRCWSEIQRLSSQRLIEAGEQRFRSVLEASTMGIIVNEVDGRFTYANPPLLRMLGYTQSELNQGQLSWSRIQAPDRVVLDDLALSQLRNTGTCDPYETEFIARDGRRIPVYVGASFIPNETGDGLLGAAFVTDLTELKDAGRKLLALNAELDDRVRDRTAQLERANEEMEAFTYHVAHDLRTPLRAIVSTSRILEEDFGPHLPEIASQYLSRQVNAGRKLGLLIDDLLKLSRLAREEVVVQPLDLSEIAQEVANEHAPENELASIEIKPNMVAHGDTRLIRLLLSNLISNALRYSPEGGTIVVGSDETPRGRAFFVRDQGIGFDMKYIHKLFKPFERLVTDAEFPGTGVGLANAARIIGKHQGQIWAESTPGNGATFFFQLRPNDSNAESQDICAS